MYTYMVHIYYIKKKGEEIADERRRTAVRNEGDFGFPHGISKLPTAGISGYLCSPPNLASRALTFHNAFPSLSFSLYAGLQSSLSSLLCFSSHLLATYAVL